MKQFGAPWSRTLVVSSALGGLLVVVLAVLQLRSRDAPDGPAMLLLAVLAGAALFTVRGYVVGREGIFVRRLLWSTRLPLLGLESATHDPKAIRRSVRGFGNGGLFAFSGWFRNGELGWFRMFVTNTRNAVVLRYGSRTIVVSPEEPDRFVDVSALVRSPDSHG